MKKKYMVPETHLFFCTAAAPLAGSITETETGAQTTLPGQDDEYNGDDWNSRRDGRHNVWDDERELEDDNYGW